ncbi:MAG: F0F1 ATP synthase subunit A [Syntrophotaleaceae bacterium]
MFLLTHSIGFKKHGLSYIKHFTGSIWWLMPLMLPIEIIGHLARARVSSHCACSAICTATRWCWMVFLALAPAIVPIPMMLMGILVAFIQAFVFTLLSMIYFAGALEEAH